MPRQEAGLKGIRGQYWDRPAPGEPYLVPTRDRDGDWWNPLWPVNSVSWDDALAYVAWRVEQDGLPWSLPTEHQWEKAARGTDGRVFPWGDRLDPTLCKMRDSREGHSRPESIGAFATDCSPYGVRDMAGNGRDWCGDQAFDDDTKRRPVRGGSWYSSEPYCRVAYRYSDLPWFVRSDFGFRLARAAP